jgi:hypothetical protein
MQPMAKPFRCPIHDMPDCSPLLNGCSIPTEVAERVAAAGAERYAAALADAQAAIKAIERHQLLMIDLAGRLETCIARADALDAVASLGKADA